MNDVLYVQPSTQVSKVDIQPTPTRLPEPGSNCVIDPSLLPHPPHPTSGFIRANDSTQSGHTTTNGLMTKAQATEWINRNLKKDPKDSIMEMDELLDARRFDVNSPPVNPVPTLWLNGKPIATAGNIEVVSGSVKTGKTAAEGAMIAALADPSGDCLGFTGSNPNGHAVIHFDTEQSPADHYRVIVRALKRAGKEDKPPSWLRSYRVADLDYKQRRLTLFHEIKRAAKIHGGICAIFLDGVADFVEDPNDSSESINFVGILHKLAIENNCVIMVILHENPGSDFGKTRGHLGSQLERKAESNIRLVKDGEIITAFTEKSRHCYIPKENGAYFTYDENAEMHVSVSPSDLPVKNKKKEAKTKFDMLAVVPWTERIEKNILINRANDSGIALNKCRSLITELITSGYLIETQEKRPGAKPFTFLSRNPSVDFRPTAPTQPPPSLETAVTFTPPQTCCVNV